jgi:hypothetical protein
LLRTAFSLHHQQHVQGHLEQDKICMPKLVRKKLLLLEGWRALVCSYQPFATIEVDPKKACVIDIVCPKRACVIVVVGPEETCTITTIGPKKLV